MTCQKGGGCVKDLMVQNSCDIEAQYMNISQVILTLKLDDLCTNTHNPDRLQERLTLTLTLTLVKLIILTLKHPPVIFTTQ